eukprot:Trichotokara_eunicae@DN3336_c0_g1_i1.p1
MSGGLKFIHGGCKVIERLDDKMASQSRCRFRLTQSGAPLMRSITRHRCMTFKGFQLLKKLLEEGEVKPDVLKKAEPDEVEDLNALRSTDDPEKFLAGGLLGKILIASPRAAGEESPLDMTLALLMTPSGTLKHYVQKARIPRLIGQIEAFLN